MVTVKKNGSSGVCQDIVGVYRLQSRYFLAKVGHSQVGDKDTQPFRQLTESDKPPVLPKKGKFDMREERNPYCKFYDRCLDIAARESECFCCTGCRHFKEQTERTILSSIELLNIYKLWRVVFQSE